MSLDVSGKQKKHVNGQGKGKPSFQQNIHPILHTNLGGLLFPFLTESPSSSASKLSICDSNSPTYSILKQQENLQMMRQTRM